MIETCRHCSAEFDSNSLACSGLFGQCARCLRARAKPLYSDEDRLSWQRRDIEILCGDGGSTGAVYMQLTVTMPISVPFITITI